jgi:hypothetical protein
MKRRKSAEERVKKLSPTELLVLALVWGQHANTLYSLQKETLHSAGALAPAVAKLVNRGLLEIDSPGPRSRVEFHVSKGVVKAMEHEWKIVLQDHIGDCDAVLKLCKAGEIFDLPAAIEFAQEAAALRELELRKYKDDHGRLKAPELDPFRYISYWEVERFHRLQAEQHTIRAVEAGLRKDL